MGDGSRAATSSGARAAIGLAKAEAVAETIRLVSYQRLERIVIMQLTESQESSQGREETHRDWCAVRGGIGFEDRSNAGQ